MWMVPPLLAWLIAGVGTPLAGALGRRVGLLDRPNELSIHDRPVPRSGGLALLVAFAAAALATWKAGLLSEAEALPTLGLLLGAGVVAAAGLLDDLRHISPLHKFLWELIGAAVAIGLGVRPATIANPGLASAFTLVLLVGVANAVNLLDGMNGMAAGAAAIAALGLAGLGRMAGQPSVWLLALVLAGACLGYLPHNFPRARIFMGDSGSLFLGFVLAGLAVRQARTPGDWSSLLAALLVLALPLTDTALAMARRFGRFQDLFSGDREHLYDLLSQKGLGDLRAVLVMYALGGAAGGLALGVARLPLVPATAVTALAFAALIALAGRLGALGSRGSVTVARFRQAARHLVQRYGLACVGDGLIVAASFYLALFLRFSPDIPQHTVELPRYLASLTETLPFILFLYLLVNAFFGLYSRVWRYASVQEALAITGSGLLSTGGVLIAELLPGVGRPVPLSVVVVGGVLSLMGFAASRYRFRVLTRLLGSDRPRSAEKPSRTLIVGAGEAGQLLAWQMLHQSNAYQPVGFVDDDPDTWGLRLHGLKVLGDRHRIPELVRALGVDLVVIAEDDGHRHPARDELVDLCLASEARVRLLPDVLESLVDDRAAVRSGSSLSPLREVRIEDLLGRAPVIVDREACAAVLRGQVVLVTGAAGSIGSELCRQVLEYGPARVLALDQNETGLYDLALELGAALEIIVADIRDAHRMERVFDQHRPGIVYHAAAYKHVPILEQHPGEAFATNVLGTLSLIAAAERHGAARVIVISTDKAVCPCSALGVSKRLGEWVVEAAAQQGGNGAVFASVRFGNVLGSRGSVLPTFLWQIEHGGPVTVTEPGMTRYFMSIHEAVALVIEASAYAQGGEVFVLDMGEPVSVDQLARRMIRLRGLRVGQDIEIRYIGARPGEKLTEKLWCERHEQPGPTPHPAIFCLHRNHHLDGDALAAEIGQMQALLDQGREAEMCTRMYELALAPCQGCAGYPVGLTPPQPSLAAERQRTPPQPSPPAGRE